MSAPPTITPRTITLDGRTFPVAGVVKVEPNRTYPAAVVVTVACPLCRKRHTHGALRSELTDAHLGHRAAHCASQYRGDGYVLGPVSEHLRLAVAR